MNSMFQRCSHYTLCEIAGVPYLLPFGQPVADHQRGLKLNASGVLLWRLLAKAHTFDELLDLFAGHYEASGHELPLLKEDLISFLSALYRHGLLRLSAPEKIPDRAAPSAASDSLYMEIGGLTLQLCGPAEAFSDAFAPFLLPAPQTPHQVIQVISGAPLLHRNGTLLVRNEELMVVECPACYLLFFPNSPGLLEVRLAKDGTRVECYCLPPYTEALQDALFHALRLMYLYLAQKHGRMALHSASLLYRDRAWLFSAPSGTGKSTHADLWNRLFGTPLLNGDLNLLAVEDGLPLVYGLPWCGTSGISTTATCTLGGIFLLKRAPEDRVESLPRDQRILLAAHRLISPVWTKAQLLRNLDFMEQLEPHILLCRLHCTKEPGAAVCSRHAADQYMDRGETHQSRSRISSLPKTTHVRSRIS